MRPGVGHSTSFLGPVEQTHSHISDAKAWRKSWSDAVQRPKSGTWILNNPKNPSILATYLLGAQCTLSLSLA